MAAGMMTRVNIDVSRIKNNRETGALDPVIRIVDEDETRFAHYLEILGPCRVVYDPSRSGTTCWIETESELHVVENALVSADSGSRTGAEITS